jgi:hypothetical protein
MSAISVNGESPAVAECSSTSRIFSPVRGAARLARDGDGKPVGAQRARQFFQLRALAAAVETFEGDKFSARATSEMIAGVQPASVNAVPDFCDLRAGVEPIRRAAALMIY